MQPDLRASDADRNHTLELLQQHTTAGRLTLDEFTARAGAVYQAATHGDLAALTGDLPPEPSRLHRAPAVPVLATVLIGAVMLIVGLGVAAVIAALAGWTHLHPMMTSMNSIMGGGCGP